mmetsp:Transcript_111995/g.349025  ORF Transcript_111995/g.349025 Transcript_111995/m.349025 type:complete len:289 (+) Transcript_111995:195-1061(+)
MGERGSGGRVVVEVWESPPSLAAAAAFARCTLRALVWRQAVTLSVPGKRLSARSASFPFGDIMKAFQWRWTGTLPLAWVPLNLKSNSRCWGYMACVTSSSFSTSRASEARASICCSPGASACCAFHRSINRAFWLKMSGMLPTSLKSTGGSNKPSSTGCNRMSPRATAAHARVASHATRRNRCLCGPGSILSVSLRMTKRGSRKSTKRSRQPGNHTAAKSATSNAARAQRCHVFRWGKQTMSETAATTSSTMHVKNSGVSGGNAASPTLGGERPQAATAATKATAETR